MIESHWTFNITLELKSLRLTLVFLFWVMANPVKGRNVLYSNLERS